MKTLEKGQEKLQKICDVLRLETLEPAKKQAEQVVKKAEGDAEKIIRDAEVQAEKLLEVARRTIEQEKSAFQSSLQQASKQGLEALRQDIEERLFNDELHSLLVKDTAEPKVVAKLITAVIGALEKEGLAADFTTLIPKSLPAKAVVAELGENVLKRLKERSVEVGTFAGGAKVKLDGKKMTLDISDEALKELMVHYIRKDFRDLIFSS